MSKTYQMMCRARALWFLAAVACGIGCTGRPTSASHQDGGDGSVKAPLSGEAEDDDARDGGPTVVAHDGRRGIVISASEGASTLGGTIAWTPGRRVVRELEETVDAFLRGDDPGMAAVLAGCCVSAQYEGLLRDGQRVVHVTYFVDDPAAPSFPREISGPRIQADGCYIDLLYWPVERKYAVEYASSFCAPMYAE